MELEQFKCGLESLGVLQMMKKHPRAFIKAFRTKPMITLDVFKSFYKIKYTSRREKEDIIIKNWFKFLSDVEQGMFCMVQSLVRRIRLTACGECMCHTIFSALILVG